MSTILVKFYREVAGQSVLVRTEYCNSLFEADSIIEQEEGHYDHVSIIDLDGNS
jgi:hypothetical protein